MASKYKFLDPDSLRMLDNSECNCGRPHPAGDHRNHLTVSGGFYGSSLESELYRMVSVIIAGTDSVDAGILKGWKDTLKAKAPAPSRRYAKVITKDMQFSSSTVENQEMLREAEDIFTDKLCQDMVKASCEELDKAYGALSEKLGERPVSAETSSVAEKDEDEKGKCACGGDHSFEDHRHGHSISPPFTGSPFEREMRILCQEIVVDGPHDVRVWKDKLNSQCSARVKKLLGKLKITVLEDGKTVSGETYERILEDITLQASINMLVAGCERLEKIDKDGVDSVEPAIPPEVISKGVADNVIRATNQAG